MLSGITADGGYAEVMIAEARGIAAIPDALGSAEAAPLLCAGLTTFNALRNAGLRAKTLGAHVYVDAAAEDAAAALQRMGGASAIPATGTSGAAMGALVPGLAPRGKLIVVGVTTDPIHLSAVPLVFGGRSVHGSLTGAPIDSEDTLAFSLLQNVRPMIETFPLERAAEAHARMMEGKARFRAVLVTRGAAA